MTMAKTTHVVMLSSTHDAALGEVVAVTPEQAKALIDGNHARAPYSGEVKAAVEGK